MRCEGLKRNPPTCRKSSRIRRAYYFSEIRCLQVLLNTHGCFLNKAFANVSPFICIMYKLCEANEGQGGINHFWPCVPCFYCQPSSLCSITSLSARQRFYCPSFLMQTLNNSVLISGTATVISLQIGHKVAVLFHSLLDGLNCTGSLKVSEQNTINLLIFTVLSILYIVSDM